MIPWVGFRRALSVAHVDTPIVLASTPSIRDPGVDSTPPSMSPPRNYALRRWQVLLWLALPCCFYLIPILAGYGWTSQSPGTPNVLALDALDGYDGRTADVSISVERYGTGVVFVPFQARLREFLHHGDLPLWNPYQGLGEPFAAQGDGNPYFPVEIVRALLPYSLGNYVTFAEFYVATVFLYLFLRGLGLSTYAAIFGGVSFALSGALSLHIPRPNIADQVCMIPILFWAAARVIRERTALNVTVLGLVAGLHLLGGFIQIAMISAVIAVAFCAVYAWTISSALRVWLRLTLTSVAVFVLGNTLAAFYLLPQLEAAKATFNKNVELLAFLPMPYANLTAFFFPIIFGPFFQSWVPIGYPEGVDWNNLYAYAGMGLLLLPICGWLIMREVRSSHHVLLAFFALAGVVLLLRYVSFPLVSGIDLLPGLGRQSPKHSQGLAVLCFIVAAAIAADHIRANPRLRLRWPVALALVLAGSSFLTVVGKAGGWSAVNLAVARVYVVPTLLLLGLVLSCVWCARRLPGLSKEGAAILLTAAVAAELSVYIPLGNASPDFLYARLSIAALVIASGMLYALGPLRVAVGAFATAMVGYSLLIVLPSVGLPRQFDMDTPPPFLRWLASAAGSDYRTFGIPPDFSSLASVQDLSTVGPLAPREFADFVSIISSPGVNAFYRSSSTFMLTTVPEDGYNLDRDYLNVRPLLDWFGVRYLVLDRTYFRPAGRTDDQRLQAKAADIHPVYDDPWVYVLASDSAQAKALFSSSVVFYPDQAAIIRELRAHPDVVFGPLMVEAGSMPRLPPNLTDSSEGSVQIVEYRPDVVTLSVAAPRSGVAVLKDSYFPGWKVTINGASADVVRVNGLVRGVVLPAAGQYLVQFTYQPDSFVQGLWLAGLAGALFLAVLLRAGVAYLRLRIPALRTAEHADAGP
jgi:hypothetical protein